MADQYGLIVLGSGPGGYVAAIRASQLRLKVAIVEREKLGGICLNWGCIPTKALLRTSEINHYLTHASTYGLSAEKVSFDLAKIVDRSRKVAGQLNAGVKGLMKKNKVTVVEGEGKLTAKGKLQVGDKELQARHIIIATGARARPLPFAKADGERIWTYRHAMVPKEMPSKLLVIGSGAIGVEFASFYSDMGAEVTIVEMLDRILPVEDEEVSAFVHKQLTRQGMKIHVSSGVDSLEAGVVCVEAIAGKKPHPFETWNIPGCTYSRPQVASVGLTEAKAKAEGRKVKVGKFPFIGNGKAIALGEAEGFVKTVFDENTGELLGAHMVGAEVTELIQGYAIARQLETTHGGTAVSSWMEGAPEKSLWTGVKVTDRARAEIATWRCNRCGFLEHY